MTCSAVNPFFFVPRLKVAKFVQHGEPVIKKVAFRKMSGLFLFMLPVHFHYHIEGLTVGNFKLTILPGAVRE
jgi:hypothetical protein